MTARKLDKSQWRTFFDRLSKTLEGKQAEIEVASLSLGDQVEAEWLLLHGITYDPNDDLVEVALEFGPTSPEIITPLMGTVGHFCGAVLPSSALASKNFAHR